MGSMGSFGDLAQEALMSTALKDYNPQSPLPVSIPIFRSLPPKRRSNWITSFRELRRSWSSSINSQSD